MARRSGSTQSNGSVPPMATPSSETQTNHAPALTKEGPTNDHDLERGVNGLHNEKQGDDPFGFAGGVKTDTQLNDLRNRKKGKVWKRKDGKGLARHYEKQNELIDAALKPMNKHTQEGQEKAAAARLPVRIAVWASLIANVSLSVLQLYAAISSLSLSFFATAIDSVFDPCSNVLLYFLHRKAKRLDTNKWPVGGNRLETIGNICYGALMGAVNLVIIVESARSIITHSSDDSDTNEFHIPAVAAVGAALGTKITLFLYCYTIRRSSSQVQVLWEDHRNDILVNGFGLLTSTGGSRLIWFLDPMGAIIIGLTVSLLWGYRIYREFELLAGKSAPHAFVQLITYKAVTFDSEHVQRVDTVRAYHSGPKYVVEIDIQLSPTTPLRLAHDIGQSLQDEIEVLPGVERAFVHLDWETDHMPEHRGGAILEKQMHDKEKEREREKKEKEGHLH